MALKLNGRITFYNNPGVYAGAVYRQPGNFIKGGLRNRNAGGFSSRFSGYSNGTLAPSAFILPQKSGSISSYTRSSGAAVGVGSLIPGRNLEASSSMVITLTNAQLDQIVSAVASGAAAITVTDAILAGAANMTASADGVLSVLDALCGAIFSVTAASSCSVSGSGSTLTALGHISADAGGATPLSPEGLAASLLDSNDVDTGYSVRDALKLILSAVAGKVSGAETTTITFRNLPDDKNRIVATVDANGNRSSVTYDVS